MRRLPYLAVAICVLPVLIGNGSVSAEELQFVSTSKFAATQARIDELENRLASYEHGERLASHGGNVCHSRSAGFLAGGEIAFLKATRGDGGAGGFGYKPSPRVWFGYETCSGLGARVRWFDYDDQSSAPPTFVLAALDITTVDLEITDTFRWGCKWEGRIAGGVRYAECRQYLPLVWGEYNHLTDGFGPTLSIELQRHITERFALYGLARESVMISDMANNSNQYDDVSYCITEMQLGAEYRYPWCNGTSVFARGAFESQYWSGGMDQDIGLFGGSFAIGLAR